MSRSEKEGMEAVITLSSERHGFEHVGVIQRILH